MDTARGIRAALAGLALCVGTAWGAIDRMTLHVLGLD